MSIAGPEIAFDLNNKSNKTVPTFEHLEQRPIKITKKSPYKKAHDFKGFNKGKAFIIGLGTIIVAAGIILTNVNISEAKNASTPITTFEEVPLVVDNSINRNPNKVLIDTNNSIVSIDKVSFKTIDFSYDQRKEDIPTRPYKVNKLVEDKMTDDLMQLFRKYSSDYGFDHYLFAGLCMAESSLNPDVDSNKKATGICQVENTNIGSTISAYNYNTGEVDEIKITAENLNDLETNIQIGAMIFRNRLDKYEDLYIAIQSYNYGSSSIDMLIRNCKYQNPTYEELYPLIKDLHDNPHKWLSNWEQETYGSCLYVPGVLSYHIGNYTYVNTNQNTIRIYDVDLNDLVGEYRIISTNEENTLLENTKTQECLNVKNIDLPITVKKGHVK